MPAGRRRMLETRGTLQRRTDQISADVSADLDQVELCRSDAVLAGGNRRRRTQAGWSRTSRSASRATAMSISACATSTDLSTVELTRASGTLDGDGLQVHWLRPVPPIDNGQAQLRIVDPDTLEITVTGGRQRLRNQKEASAAGLQIRGGKVRITGIMQPHQIGAIDADIAGPLPDAVALLREPRLALLDRHPIDLKNPAGQTTVKVALTVPLEDARADGRHPVQVQAHLDGVHLGALVAGRDLDQGVFDLSANADGMKLNGRARAGVDPGEAGRGDGLPRRSADAGDPDRDGVRAAGRATARGGGTGCDVGAERRDAGPGGAERASQWPGRCGGHRRSDRGGTCRGAARVAQAARGAGQGVGARAAGPRPADRHRRRPARRRRARAARAARQFSGGRLSVFQLDRLDAGAHGRAGHAEPAGEPARSRRTCSGATLDLAPRLGRHTAAAPAGATRPSRRPGRPGRWTRGSIAC